MQISSRQLQRLVADVDQQHRAGMASMPREIKDLHAVTRSLRGPRAGGLDDGAIAAFAESVELAAVAAYTAAAKSGLVTTKAVLDAATAFAGHHQEHAAAFGAAAGAAATKKANPKLLEAVGAQLAAAKDEMAILEIAYGLENAAAATYLFALGALTSKGALQLTASILPVEAQHAVVLGTVLGKKATDIFPSFETQSAAVDPSKFPVAA